MAWSEVPGLRSKSAVTFFDPVTNRYSFTQVAGTKLHKNDNSRVDMSYVRRNDGVIDGWETTGADWHYRIGRPQGKATDGWVGYGGRGGESFVYFRLASASDHRL